jgi:hypothetical protein
MLIEKKKINKTLGGNFANNRNNAEIIRELYKV